MALTSTLHQSAAMARTLLLIAVPDGGQRTARRNAWAGMSGDATRGRARRAAEQAIHEASARSGPLSTPAGEPVWPAPGLQLTR